MTALGVIITKGPNAKKAPRIKNSKEQRAILKELFNAIGKPAPWEIQKKTGAASAPKNSE